MTQAAGMGEHGIEDGVMGTIRFRSGVLAQFHDAFTVKNAGTGFEVHGTEGSLIARDVMTQRPIGEVILRTTAGEAVLPVVPENLYARSVRNFHAAIAGKGQPSATGEDGIRSMAVAIAALKSARTGRTTPVEPGI
ncbi:MAG: Gfo/Idh/MocA family oxidoreductase, partial [Hyphomicrobiales bacterium]